MSHFCEVITSIITVPSTVEGLTPSISRTIAKIDRLGNETAFIVDDSLLSTPRGIGFIPVRLRSGTIYVVERGSDELSAIDSSGDVETLTTGLADPLDLIKLPNGNMLVTERVSTSTQSGYITEISRTTGAILNRFNPGFSPNDIELESDGIYVTSYFGGVWLNQNLDSSDNYTLFSDVPGDTTGIVRLGDYFYVTNVSGSPSNSLWRIDPSDTDPTTRTQDPKHNPMTDGTPFFIDGNWANGCHSLASLSTIFHFNDNHSPNCFIYAIKNYGVPFARLPEFWTTNYVLVLSNVGRPLDLAVHGVDILVTDITGSKISRIGDVEPGGSPVITTFTPSFSKASSFASDGSGGFFVSQQKKPRDNKLD